MRIRWYGQAAFSLTARDGARVFIDPFGEIPEEMLALRRERMPDFRQLRQRYDPAGKFANELVDRYVPAGG